MDDTLSNLYFLGLEPVNSRRRRKMKNLGAYELNFQEVGL